MWSNFYVNCLKNIQKPRDFMDIGYWGFFCFGLFQCKLFPHTHTHTHTHHFRAAAERTHHFCVVGMCVCVYDVWECVVWGVILGWVRFHEYRTHTQRNALGLYVRGGGKHKKGTSRCRSPLTARHSLAQLRFRWCVDVVVVASAASLRLFWLAAIRATTAVVVWYGSNIQYSVRSDGGRPDFVYFGSEIAKLVRGGLGVCVNVSFVWKTNYK